MGFFVDVPGVSGTAEPRFATVGDYASMAGDRVGFVEERTLMFGGESFLQG